MDNQRGISRSYFLNKSNIKNKNKKTFKNINKYDEDIKILKQLRIKNHQDNMETMIIKLFEERIEKSKEKIKQRTSVYLY